MAIYICMNISVCFYGCIYLDKSNPDDIDVYVYMCIYGFRCRHIYVRLDMSV